MKNKVPICVIAVFVLVISTMVFLILLGDGYLYTRVYITQDVEISDFTDNTYTIDSCLWIKYKGDLILESRFVQYHVLCAAIPKIKQWHLTLLEEEKIKVLERVKSFEACEHY